METKTPELYQKEIDQLTTEKAQAEKERDEAIAERDAALEASDSLSDEIEKLSKVPADYFKNKTAEKINPADHSFEFEGKKYGFNYPKQTHKGQVITPIEVKASAELQAALISSESSMLKAL